MKDNLLNSVLTNGNFDARKARQALYEWQRDNRIVRASMDLATHLGLSGEDAYLMVALNLLAENVGLFQALSDHVARQVPTFLVQPTKDGPFAPEVKPWGKP